MALAPSFRTTTASGLSCHLGWGTAITAGGHEGVFKAYQADPPHRAMPGLAGAAVEGVEAEGLCDLVARALDLDRNRALGLMRRVIEAAPEGVQRAVKAVSARSGSAFRGVRLRDNQILVLEVVRLPVS